MLHKHGSGLVAPVQYAKRVHHDTIVPKEEYQDLYQQLKQKYAWIVEQWKENTDPVKHVFEDVGIATFLICLWRDLYKGNGGKPPGGFVDVGCGNGLL
jgi:tRNASer (uridine44-2'-O)-methyltransferase